MTTGKGELGQQKVLETALHCVATGTVVDVKRTFVESLSNGATNALWTWEGRKGVTVLMTASSRGDADVLADVLDRMREHFGGERA